MDEWSLIKQYFLHPASAVSDSSVTLGMGDDAAIIRIPAGFELVTSTDTVVSGVHFPENTPFEVIGCRALVTALSDLAAMGAEPRWALLSLTLPQVNATDLSALARGFFDVLHAHGMCLVGGDTTQGSLSLTVQVMGLVPVGTALRRAGAQVGDAIWVTGSLGGAGAALQSLQAQIAMDASLFQALLPRFYAPEARIAAGLILRDYAHACIDISDGLFSDLGHILQASGVGATVQVDRVPLEEGLVSLFPAMEAAVRFAVCFGDDYELCFTAPQIHSEALEAAFLTLGLPVQCIGHITLDKSLRWQKPSGAYWDTQGFSGYRHFK